ncbi:MAG: S8 family serine peptidase [Rudaea sp.]|uniref:S8 family serine peptidase n=1 Tax=Rudaea sp. TaxID=2136325 RepID=UPI0039E4D479
MKFPLAWRTTRGHGYIGTLDSGVEEIPDPVRWDTSKQKWPLAKHADLRANYRPQFSNYDVPIPPGSETIPGFSFAAHGTHVSGILAATTNGSGVAGACPDCSLAMIRRDGDLGDDASGVHKFAERGVQAFNMSFEWDDDLGDGYDRWDCPVAINTHPVYSVGVQAFCDGLTLAANYDSLPLAAAGNFAQTGPAFPARVDSVLAVAGAQYEPANSYGWLPWAYTPIPHAYSVSLDDGTNYGGKYAVTAPAKRIVSTFPLAVEWSSESWIKCSDIYPTDESGPPRTSNEASDGYGSCTGTSMAAPHVTALAGILRSVNPLLNAGQIKDILRASSDHYHADPNQNDPVIGSGMPDANLAVAKTLQTNADRLTPLFAFYSTNRRDRFYTTVPQMGSAAAMGTLEPRGSGAASTIRYGSQGTTIATYGGFPGLSQFSPTILPKAEAWVFTTPQNPVNPTDPLLPLYRLSWKCGDDTPVPPTSVCNASNQQHIDVAYTTSAVALDAFKSIGYALDGIEGYVFPKTSPQPPGTVKLLSRYNPTLDDNAIFPETLAASMTGYTDSSEPDGWLGYVYVNTGTKPVPVAQPHYVKRTLAFAPQWATAARVVCNDALNSYCRLTEVEVRDDRNWAAAANDATASASSTYSANYPAAAAIDGDRLGANWSHGGGWNDANAGVFPDWLQVSFAASHVIDTVTVYTLQDNFPNPAEPDDTLTFSAYGLTAFDVQVWNGSAWATVASVTGNNLVKRKVGFAPVSTSAIRIVCNAGQATAGAYSRIVEVEARDGRNWAAAANGATASASSVYNANYPVAAIIDGDRKGLNWARGGGWNDATADVFPDWARIDFNTTHWFSQVSVYTLQDNYANPVEPTDTTRFTLFGITAFDVQVWNGANWISLGTVSN